ncbi:MAG: NADH-quinone oxidoreductase subunit J, partial [Alphaproteobacteria bacterium]
LIIVYVGAVAVLFLFVVMMLDVNIAELRQGFLEYLPIGGLIGMVLLVELAFIVTSWTVAPDAVAQAPTPAIAEVTNAEALGRLLYTRYIFLFQAAGLLLLVAMIGAIVLTLRQREGVRRQRISRQIARTREDSIEIKKVKTGTGI